MPTEQMEEKYKVGILKEYSYWTLAISFRQTTLGCFIILAKRPTEKISDLSNEELIELRQVMQEIEKALQSADKFKPDRLNYLQLGNSLHQLHFHGIPRYASSRKFAGREWVDIRYGNPPIIVSKEEESEIDLIHKIKEALMIFI